MKKRQYICDCNIIHEDIVNEVIASMEDSLVIDKICNIFRVIGDSTRCRIISILLERELCVCDISNILNMTKSAVSHQLAILKKNNIVKCHRRGKEIYYSIVDDHIVLLFSITKEHIKERSDKYEV